MDNSNSYPRTYLISTVPRFSMSVAAMLILAVGLWLPFGVDAKSSDPSIFLQLISVALVVFAILLILVAITYRVVLTQERVEVRGLFTARILDRKNVASKRTIQARNSIVLIPRDSVQKPLEIMQNIRSDDVLLDWLAKLPDQDLLDAQSFEQDVVSNPLYGSQSEERSRRLEQLRRLTRTLNIAGLVVGVWGLIAPQPYGLVVAVLVSCPMIGLVVALKSQGLIQINQDRRDKRPSVTSLMSVPAVALALRALLDVHLVNWQMALIGSVVGAVLINLCIARADIRTKKWPTQVALFLIITLPYVYGGVVELNVLLDMNQARSFEAKVLEKRMTSGRTADWYFTITAWGPVAETREVSVTRDLYDRTNIENAICIDLHPGAFGIDWFVLRACADRIGGIP